MSDVNITPTFVSKFQKFRQYLFTRRPPTNFILHFTLSTGWLGLCTGMLTLYTFVNESKVEEERISDFNAIQSIEKINDKFSRTEVSKSLYQIEKYKRTILTSPSFPYSLFSKKIEGNKWASVWWSERKIGNEDSLDVENSRKNLKSLFYFLKHHYDRNPKRQKDFDDVFFNEPFNKEIVEKFIHYVEPLDMERCFQNPSCTWEKDSPLIYNWLRKIYEIKE
jgi:hypothetical protein